MSEPQLRRVLADLAAQGVPEGPDLWPGIRTRMAQGRDRSRRGRAVMRRHSLTRLISAGKHLPSRAAILALALIGLVLIGTGYAALPLVQQQLSESPEGQQMLAYGKSMHLVRTVGAYTISLDFAYADRDGGLLGYTIDAPRGRAFGNQLDQVTLSSDGTEVPIVGGSGIGSQADMTRNFVSFGGIPQAKAHSEVPLRLTVGAIDTNRPDGTTRTVPGPWVFDFTVPVAPTRFITAQLARYRVPR